MKSVLITIPEDSEERNSCWPQELLSSIPATNFSPEEDVPATDLELVFQSPAHEEEGKSNENTAEIQKILLEVIFGS